LVNSFGLSAFENTSLKNCSSGVVRKASLVRALISEAELLLLDEPYNFLDQGSRSVLDQTLSNFVEKGGSVVIASNNVLEGKLKFAETWIVKDQELERSDS